MIELQPPADQDGFRVTTGCCVDPTARPCRWRGLCIATPAVKQGGDYVLWDRTCKRDYVTLKDGRRSARKRWIHNQVELGRFTAEQLTEESVGERQEPMVISG